MKKTILFGLIILLLSGCGISLQTVVEPNLTKTYDNLLLVIPYEHNTLDFAEKFELTIEELFSTSNQKIEVLLFEQSSDTDLSLNSPADIEIKINNMITKDAKDLIIVFKPVSLEYLNDGLQSASYQLVGTDIETDREIWKANLSSSCAFGPVKVAKRSAREVYQKLKDDNILK